VKWLVCAALGYINIPLIFSTSHTMDMDMIVEQCVVLVKNEEDCPYSLFRTISWITDRLFENWPGDITSLRGTVEKHFYNKLRDVAKLVRLSFI
jgi:hypothetical protein